MAQSIGLNRKRQVPAEETPGFGAIAERFRRAGDLERAVALCLEGLAKFPNIVSARVTLGWALLDLGRYDEARQALETALKRAPDNLAAIRGLAELHDRAEHTMTVPMDGPAALDSLEVDPAAADGPAQAEPLSLDSVLAGARPKGHAKGKKGKDQPAAEDTVDVVMTPAAQSGAIPDLIQSTSHRGHQPSQPAPGAPPASADEASGVDLNALLNEIGQADATVAIPEESGVDLSTDSDDADIEKALQMAQAAAEQAAADAAATRKAAEEQSATEAAARRAAEEQSAAEAAARKAAEEKAAVERAARQAAEERAAVAEAAARKAAEDKAASEAAARRAAEEKAAEEAAAKKAAEKAAAEAAARQAAEQKAAAEKAEAEAKARKAAEEKAAAEAAARKAAEEKAAAEKAARQAAEKAAAEAARQAAEDRAAAEAAAKKAAEERAAAEAAARRAAEEKAEKAEAAAKLAAKTAAAEAEARRAAEDRAAAEAAARAAAEDAAANARPILRLTNPAAHDFPDPHIQIRAEEVAAAEAHRSDGPYMSPLLDALNGFEATPESAGRNGAANGVAAQSAVEYSQPGSILNLSSPVPVSGRTGSPRRALPELESLLRRVESRRAQLMTESVA